MVKRTPGVPPGTSCGRCGRSKADEPDQFRIRRRNGREALNHTCKPCEGDLRKVRRAKVESGSLRCRLEGCERGAHASGWCEVHYRRLRETGDPGPVAIRRRGTGDDRCEFEGCERPHLSRGLCGAHYQQRRVKGQPVAAVRSKRYPEARDELGRKLCGTCEAWLTLEHYTRNVKTKDELSTVCRRCQRNSHLMRRFGIALVEYEAMLLSQDGGCAACGKTEEVNGRMLAVDHDHACCPGNITCGKCLRGLLCNPCNLVLGMTRDDVGKLGSLITYLRKANRARARTVADG